MRNDLTGKKFGPVEVLAFSHTSKKHNYWKCLCHQCGSSKVMCASNLRSPKLRSCGCLRRKPGSSHKNWKGYGEIPASYLCKIKSQAKRRGIPVSLTVKDLWEQYEKQQGKCALTGVDLTYPQSFKAISQGDGNASLDRIDSDKPYQTWNIQWVDKEINFMKQQFSVEHFIELCERVVNYSKKGT